MKELNKMESLFSTIAGSRLSVLKYCPTERSRHVNLGLIILSIAIFSGISGAYAIQTIFNNLYLSIAFGIFWGTTILLIDRYMIASLRGIENTFNSVIQFSFRILLSVFIGIVISVPLEIKIMKEPIVDFLREEKVKSEEQKYSLMLSNKDREIDRLNKMTNDNINIISQLTNNLSNAAKSQSIANSQAQKAFYNAIGSTKSDSLKNVISKRNRPVFRTITNRGEKQIESLMKRSDLYQNKIDSITKLKSVLGDELKESINKKSSKLNNASFPLMWNAMNRVIERNDYYRTISLWLRGLFILLECMPILIKLFTPSGLYEELFVYRVQKQGAFSKIAITKDLNEGNS